MGTCPERAERVLHSALAEHPPESVAVSSSGTERTITYGELEMRSTLIARWLEQVSVRPGDRVALYHLRTAELIAALYGVLKAGGAYVPIDIFAPPARARRLVEDCRPKAIVTDRGRLNALCQEGLIVASGIPALLLGEGETGAGQEHPLEVVPGADSPTLAQCPLPQDPAYILYTSGSTGFPKGVVHSHSSALTFVEWAQRRFRVSRADRVAGYSPLHFDLSTFDLFATALAGAELVLMRESDRRSPAALVQFLVSSRITILYAVPTVLLKLLLAPNRSELPGELRLILFAGEVFPVTELKRLHELMPQVELFNLYGPTETNVCTYHEVSMSDLSCSRPLPIGKPCSYASLTAVGPNGVTAPPETGVEFELGIEGESVMLGYWSPRDGIVNGCFGSGEGTSPERRIYASGDICRLGTDGRLLFLGRRDRMVKLLGQRIELAEIEHAVLLDRRIAEAAALAEPEGAQAEHLAVYFVVHEGIALDIRDLRRHLLKTLPRSWMPDRLKPLPSLPRTSGGKIDYAVLREQARAEAVTQGEAHL